MAVELAVPWKMLMMFVVDCKEQADLCMTTVYLKFYSQLGFSGPIFP